VAGAFRALRSFLPPNSAFATSGSPLRSRDTLPGVPARTVARPRRRWDESTRRKLGKGVAGARQHDLRSGHFSRRLRPKLTTTNRSEPLLSPMRSLESAAIAAARNRGRRCERCFTWQAAEVGRYPSVRRLCVAAAASL
jgi:hypothetical protein